MRWTKRLKWLRISKIVIPIALAISLVFAGFSVYGSEAQNFVIRTQGADGVQLSLTMNYDLSNQTSMLYAPVVGSQTDATFDEVSNKITSTGIDSNNDISGIACREDTQNVVLGYTDKEEGGLMISFFAFSFFLVNNSGRPVDYDMVMTIDGLSTFENAAGHHIDDALRVMVIDGESDLSEKNYIIYGKDEAETYAGLPDAEEKTALAREQLLNSLSTYHNSVRYQPFVNSNTVLSRSGELGYKNFADGESRRYTVVIWIEGEDLQCTNELFGEQAKMSITFIGY